MKKINIRPLLVFFISLCAFLHLEAQPPNPPGDPSAGGDPVGGSAPIGSGLGILLAMGAAYAGKKVWDYRNVKCDE